MGARSENVKPWKAPLVKPSQAEARVARAALDQLQALHEALGRTPPPCDDDARWTSDERADVRHATAGCQPCHAREECLAYGQAIAARTSTWGGVHLGPRWTRATDPDTETEELTA